MNPYIPNMYRIKKFKEGFLIVAEQGGWVYLKRKDFRRFIKGDLDDNLFGMLEKAGIILTEKNTDEIVKAEYNRRRFMRSPPGLHIILPTVRCNHQCVYCHSAAKTHGDFDMDKETARKIVDFIMDVPGKKKKIEYQGGDATINFDIVKEIFEYASAKGSETGQEMGFSLVTNTTLLDEKMIEWIARNKISLATSIDGPKDLHDKNRPYVGGKGTYEDVIKKMKLCHEKGVRAGALMVTTRYSLSRAKDIVDEYVKLGMDSIQLKFLNKIGDADDKWKEIGYSAEEYIEFWKEAMEYLIEVNKKGTKIVERLTGFIVKKILTYDEPGFLDFRNPCGIALGQIAYNYNGDIYSCDEGRGFDIFKLGNVKEMDWVTYIGNPQVRNLVEMSVLETSYCDTCVYKPYCGQCPVLNYAETGNLIPKVAKSTRCKIFKAMFDWVFKKMLTDAEAREVLSSWLPK
ncbi:His-Xaa-Ser system radical SAM maturase HxsB [Nanoarchaeota archaeon]